MKNSLNLSAAVLIFIVLGCACPLDKFIKAPPPPPPPPPANAPAAPSAPSGPSRTPGSTSSSSISMEKYNQLKNDMSKAEVERLLGGPGEELSSSSGGGLTFTVYKWSGENYSAIIVTFQNDKLKYKSQVALK